MPADTKQQGDLHGWTLTCMHQVVLDMQKGIETRSRKPPKQVVKEERK